MIAREEHLEIDFYDIIVWAADLGVISTLSTRNSALQGWKIN